MPTSARLRALMANASWIRKMFEEGNRLRAELGPERVFDFSLGNPDLEPPPQLAAELQRLVQDDRRGAHAYMPNTGYPEVREAVAAHLRRLHGQHFTREHVVMTVGAAGALNCELKAILEPGDEVLVFVPYFPEYRFYIDNHDGVTVPVETDAGFGLDLAEVERHLSPRTRAAILCSPNNPTGRIYDRASLQGLAELLQRQQARGGRPIYLIADEPYRQIVYDDVELPSIFALHPAAIVCTSHSKDLAIPGERIGYVAINPEFSGVAALVDGLAFSNRILGYVNAPALMQRLVAQLQEVTVDPQIYQRRRDLLVEGLRAAGWPVEAPQGSFYLFPRTPLADDVRFVELLKRQAVLVVPGAGFGRPGHVRIAYCVPEAVIRGSLPGFAAAVAEARQ